VTRTCRFGPLVVAYDERVIAPRPWTEAQSRWAAEIAATAPQGPMLELCAGAGHIGLLAARLTGRDLVQVEADPVAAEFAQLNAVRAGVAERVTMRCSDLEEALAPDERFAVVMADPPYLPTDQVERWPGDPPLAIDGGADGLRLVRSCLAVIDGHLAVGGTAILQVWGERQAVQVGELVADHHSGLAVGELRSEDDDRALLALHQRG
jgi:release factor glutamine methyltransferase